MLVRKLSTDAEKRELPIVVVTASGAERDSFGHPALVDWITKPFQEKRLHVALDLENCWPPTLRKSHFLVTGSSRLDDCNT